MRCRRKADETKKNSRSKSNISLMPDWLVLYGSGPVALWLPLSERYPAGMRRKSASAVYVPYTGRILLSRMRRNEGRPGTAAWTSPAFSLVSSGGGVRSRFVGLVSDVQHDPMAYQRKISCGKQISQMVWHRGCDSGSK